MVFSSHLFIFWFLPLALLAYYAAPQRLRHLALTAASYVFYGWANPLFVFLLLFSTMVDYAVGLALTGGRPFGIVGGRPLDPDAPRTRRQRLLLLASIVSNLGLLGFFKYFNFGIESYDTVVRAAGLEAIGLDVALRVTLPLGISFYTFQTLSYTIDVYRGRTAAVRSFIDFACFVSMFPQLVAGPIVRFSEMAGQLRHREHTCATFARGVALFSVGLAKKVLIANPCGKVADMAFDAGSVAAIDAWHGAVAYAFQIYFDFSGYSDMAIGLGLMFGFAFPKNFDSPYLAQSITEFWQRWHISLSTWLRDYLYLPLGGNRRGARRTYVNLMIVMLLGGLWHGAAWKFVVWGGFHGAVLALERGFGRRAIYGGLPRPARIAATFLIVLVGWVFFRAADLGSAMRYLGAMAGLGEPQAAAGLIGGVMHQPYYLGTVGLAAIITWTCPQAWEWSRQLTMPKAIAAGALFVTAVTMLATQAYNPFIYFMF
jgi:alginate O-acetyltransferase complex protein AlgI